MVCCLYFVITFAFALVYSVLGVYLFVAWSFVLVFCFGCFGACLCFSVCDLCFVFCFGLFVFWFVAVIFVVVYVCFLLFLSFSWFFLGLGLVFGLAVCVSVCFCGFVVSVICGFWFGLALMFVCCVLALALRFMPF